MSDPVRPLVSVISLCFNMGRYVIEALECLRNQTYTNFEVIVVDDGSTDDSVARITGWLEDHPAFAGRLVVKDLNEGIPATLNTGIREAQGEIITWLSDDLWDADRLDLVVRCFRELPQDVAVVFGDAIVIDSLGSVIGDLSIPRSLAAVGVTPPEEVQTCPPGDWVVLDPEFLTHALFYRCFIPAPAASVRRACYEEVGFYDESLPIEDLDFWLRASRVSRFAYMRAPLVRYRRHDTNFSLGVTSEYLEGLEETLRKHAHYFTGDPKVIDRHIREEAYRVAMALLEAGYTETAIARIRRHYLPHLEASIRSLKEDVAIIGAVIRGMFGRYRSKRTIRA